MSFLQCHILVPLIYLPPIMSFTLETKHIEIIEIDFHIDM